MPRNKLLKYEGYCRHDELYTFNILAICHNGVIPLVLDKIRGSDIVLTIEPIVIQAIRKIVQINPELCQNDMIFIIKNRYLYSEWGFPHIVHVKKNNGKTFIRLTEHEKKTKVLYDFYGRQKCSTDTINNIAYMSLLYCRVEREPTRFLVSIDTSESVDTLIVFAKERNSINQYFISLIPFNIKTIIIHGNKKSWNFDSVINFPPHIKKIYLMNTIRKDLIKVPFGCQLTKFTCLTEIHSIHSDKFMPTRYLD
jgi:hypothetical protein